MSTHLGPTADIRGASEVRRLMLRLGLYFEVDAEAPTEDGLWEMATFAARAYTDRPREDYFQGEGATPALTDGGSDEACVRRSSPFLSWRVGDGCAWALGGWRSGYGLIETTDDGAYDEGAVKGLLFWRGDLVDLGGDEAQADTCAIVFLENYADWCEGSVYRFSLDRVDVKGWREDEITPRIGDVLPVLEDIGGSGPYYDHDVEWMWDEVFEGLIARASGEGLVVVGNATFLADGIDMSVRAVTEHFARRAHE